MSAHADNVEYREKIPDLCFKLKGKVRQCCTLDTLKDFLPILSWLPHYKYSYLFNDVASALTVALVVIPQGLADASVAGLMPQYGLYSAFMGSFLYILLGTNKNVTIGITAIMSVMIREPIAHNADLAILTTFISGCILLIISLLRLGVIVRLISMPVIAGFVISSALSITSAQISHLFGFTIKSGSFFHNCIEFFSNLSKTTLRDSVLGVCTLVALLVLRKLRNINIVTRYMCLASNAFAIILGTLLCYFWIPFENSGKIASGLPEVKAPAFSTTLHGKNLDFIDMCKQLGPLLITIPLISVLECFVTLKSFSKGQMVNASQDLLVVSLSNIFGSFVGSMPVTSAFLRTAVNKASGVRTQLGGAITGAVVLLTLAFLTKYFFYIPKATLAAVNIAAMIPIIKLQRVLKIWRAKRIDLLPFGITVISCLTWKLQYGILLGVLVNILLILIYSAHPKIELVLEKLHGVSILLVNIESNSLHYAASEYLTEKVIKYLNTKGPFVQKVLINGIEIKSIDYTIAQNILSLKQDLQALNCELILWNWSKPAAGVICRLKHSERCLFKYSKTWQELISSSEITIL